MADDLRARIAEAIRRSAYDCDGKCGLPDPVCYAQHPIQAAQFYFDTLAVVEADVDAVAALVAGLVQPELDRLAAVTRFCELTATSMSVPRAECARDILRYLTTGRWSTGPTTIEE